MCSNSLHKTELLWIKYLFKSIFYSNGFRAILMLFHLSTPMSIPSNYDQQLRTTGHPPILIARLIRESKPNGKRWIDEWIFFVRDLYHLFWWPRELKIMIIINLSHTNRYEISIIFLRYRNIYIYISFNKMFSEISYHFRCLVIFI